MSLDTLNLDVPNLGAVRAALLADARAEAEAILSEADREAHERLDAARTEASEMVEAARVRGDREAAARLARQRARTRREASRVGLAARRQAYEELRVQARAAARALARSDEYGALVARLRESAVHQLGTDATVSVDPDGEPGVIAEGDGRRVDYRLVTLAERAADELGHEVAVLWS